MLLTCSCVSSIEYQGSRLSVKRWQTALKTYTMTLNERVSKASIKSREEWSGFLDFNERRIVQEIKTIATTHTMLVLEGEKQ